MSIDIDTVKPCAGCMKWQIQACLDADILCIWHRALSSSEDLRSKFELAWRKIERLIRGEFI